MHCKLENFPIKILHYWRYTITENVEVDRMFSLKIIKEAESKKCVQSEIVGDGDP